jgi:hypothetical protein
VDEFGKHNTEDLMARLDNLSIQVYGAEGSIGLIRVYRGQTELPGYPQRYLRRMKAYLTENRRMDEKRFAFQECDGGYDTQYKLYVVAAGVAIPDCQRSLIIPQATKLFDSYFYVSGRSFIADCCTILGSDAKGAAASLAVFGISYVGRKSGLRNRLQRNECVERRLSTAPTYGRAGGGGDYGYQGEEYAHEKRD